MAVSDPQAAAQETAVPEAQMSGTVPNSNSNSDSDALRATLNEVLAQLANLSARVAGLEELASLSGGEAVPVARPPEVRPPEATVRVPEPAPIASPITATDGISEEELLAISAALAAFFGVQPHIRQARLIRTGAWAQQGRVTIQSSHSLNY
jgi:hypothetical protein